MSSFASRLAVAGLVTVSGLAACLAAGAGRSAEPAELGWRQHDHRRPHPAAVEPADAAIAVKPPKDAVVLFDGSSLDAWQAPGGGPAKWKIVDGSLEVGNGTGPIETKAKFGDIQLHVEWAVPDPPKGVGQDRGNSGVFLMGQFEIQVLDSYRAETYADGQAGAIYGEYPPLFNPARPPGQWQTYDIAFRRPRFDSSGKLVEAARITLFFNGVLVQNNEEPFGPTSWLRWLPYSADQGETGPISLQDHNHPVRYRNIWLRNMPERPAPTAEQLARPKVVSLPADTLDQFAGEYRLDTKPDGAKAKIVREGTHLVVTFPFRPQPLVLEPISETEFDMPYTDGRFMFRKDEQGRVTGALFQIGDGRRELKRVTP